MRERRRVGGMPVCLERTVVLVVGVESQVGGYPYGVVALEQVGHIQSVQLPCGGWQVFAHQLTARLCEPVQSVVDIDPHGAVLFHVDQGDVGGVAPVVAGADMVDAAVVGERVSVDAVARHLPDASLGVGIDFDRGARQLAADVAVAIHGCHIVHRQQVDDGCLLVVGYPQALAGVFGEGADFYSLKGCVEALLRFLRVKDVRFQANKAHFSFHPGRCADVLAADGTLLGTFGELHPSVRSACGISGPGAAAELDFDLIFEHRAPEAQYEPLPRFPAVLRDLALVCDEGITVHELSECIRAAGGALLREAAFFDVYRGAPIPEGKKSVAFSLSFRKEDSSLTDAEIEPAMSAILRSLEEKLQAKIR